jgi:hypothetical protein
VLQHPQDIFQRLSDENVTFCPFFVSQRYVDENGASNAGFNTITRKAVQKAAIVLPPRFAGHPSQVRDGKRGGGGPRGGGGGGGAEI